MEVGFHLVASSRQSTTTSFSSLDFEVHLILGNRRRSECYCYTDTFFHSISLSPQPANTIPLPTMSALLRQTVASSSKCVARPTGIRLLSSTRARYDLMREVENKLNSKEVIERKRREFEAKYGDKLKKRVET